MTELAFVNDGNLCASLLEIIRGAEADCSAADDEDVVMLVGLKVHGSWFRVQGSRFKVQGSRLRRQST
jgi:hypothetical protein